MSQRPARSHSTRIRKVWAVGSLNAAHKTRLNEIQQTMGGSDQP